MRWARATARVAVGVTAGGCDDKGAGDSKGSREGDGRGEKKSVREDRGLVLEEMSVKFALLQLPRWTVSSMCRPISANQRCNLMPFGGLDRTEELEKLGVGCSVGKRWVVIVEGQEVGDRAVIMVDWWSECLVCIGSSVHCTENKGI